MRVLAEILECRCHLVPGVTNVVHAQAIGRTRYAGRRACNDDYGVALDAAATLEQCLINLGDHLVGVSRGRHEV